MVQYVTPEARDIARETQDVIQKRDIQGLAAVALGVAGGVVIAQELADRVLPALGYPTEPTTATGFTVSGLVKFVAALVLGTVAAQFGGLALAVSAFIGLGHLAGAGADFFNAVQRTGFFAEGSGRQRTTTTTTTTSASPDASTRSRDHAATPEAAAAADAGRNRSRARAP